MSELKRTSLPFLSYTEAVMKKNTKYCYVFEDCSGGHPAGMVSLMKLAECCSNGGVGWGVAAGHKFSVCTTCPNSGFFGGNIQDINKPSGMQIQINTNTFSVPL